MLIEVIVLLILVAYALSGYRKGLLLSLCTLLILVLSALGATVAREMFTPQAIQYAEPVVAEALEEQLSNQLAEGTRDALEQQEGNGLTIGGQEFSLGDLADFLSHFGFDVEERIVEGTGTAMEPAISAAAQSIAHALVPPIAELVIYLSAYLILYLVLHSLTLVVNLVDRLPVIHTMNHLGGAAAGLLSGFLLVAVLAVVLARTGFVPETEGPFGALFGGLMGQFT